MTATVPTCRQARGRSPSPSPGSIARSVPSRWQPDCGPRPECVAPLSTSRPATRGSRSIPRCSIGRGYLPHPDPRLRGSDSACRHAPFPHRRDGLRRLRGERRAGGGRDAGRRCRAGEFRCRDADSGARERCRPAGGRDRESGGSRRISGDGGERSPCRNGRRASLVARPPPAMGAAGRRALGRRQCHLLHGCHARS